MKLSILTQYLILLFFILITTSSVFRNETSRKSNNLTNELFLEKNYFLVDTLESNNTTKREDSSCANYRLGTGNCKSLFSDIDCKYIEVELTKHYYKSLIINGYRQTVKDSLTGKSDSIPLTKEEIPTIPFLEDLYDNIFSTWKIAYEIRPYLCDTHYLVKNYKLYQVLIDPTSLDSCNSNSITVMVDGHSKSFPKEFKILIAFREENPHYSHRLLYIAGDIPLDYYPDIIKAEAFEQKVEVYKQIKMKFEKSTKYK